VDTFKESLRGAIIFSIFLAVYGKPILNLGRTLFTSPSQTPAAVSPFEPDYIRRHVDSTVDYNNRIPVGIAIPSERSAR
jgi:hypothetical protein